MGRPRTPTNVLEMRGAFVHNPDRAEAREGEPKDVRPLGDHPKHFAIDQIEAWTELRTMGEGWLAHADRAQLEVAATLLAQIRKIGAFAAGGMVAQLTTALSKLGLTPVDRSKVNTGGKTPEGNKFGGIGKRPA